MKHRWIAFLPLLLLILLGGLLSALLVKSISIEKTYDAQIRNEVRFYAQMLTFTAQEYLENADLAGFETFCKTDFQDLTRFNVRVTLFEENGDVLADSWTNAKKMENHATRPEFQIPPDVTYYTFLRYSTTAQQEMFYCMTKFPSQDRSYWLRCAIPRQSLVSLVGRTQRDVTLFLIGSLVMAAILGFLLFRWFAQPSLRLSHVAKKIAEGDLDTPLPIAARGSLREMTLALSAMTERLKSQIFQITREKRLRDAIFAALDEGVLVLDENGTVRHLNAAARSILGLSSGNLEGRFLSELWRDTRWMEYFNTPRPADAPLVLKEEVTLDFPLGAKQIRLHIQPLHWITESGFLLVLYDMTPLRRLETYRRDFIANVSHEIKTPLTVIMGAVEALQDGAIHDPDTANRFLETLSTHARRLHSLLQDVLSLSNLECQTRKEDLPLEECPLVETVELAVSLCQPQAAAKCVRLELTDNSENRTIPHVPQMMEQVFVNLIDNAIKYSPSGATVFVQLEKLAEDGIRVTVRDSGVGIATEHQSRIFERFYRVDPSRDKSTGGTGLGLSIVKHIVQLHGGTVRVQSEPGHGSVFCVELVSGSN